ncbi:NAD(P)/FAD-dependent oxidoreductase [Celeribacter indicus]|uniref:Oxidoreductase, FAD-binding protein n=1 Tax=Celeribacter indicus TaxID=1208324 RepID=A0A0B5E2L9_9RHOB|nr:FAD-binding oxidoreductase [Celeribacter indicus]AJE47271.1 oxidoreductase, FAD-binding protein [Celeribacter indicus]SDW02135.1 gamma-glutamylputrescine oxidase [Celeribacter indicus]
MDILTINDTPGQHAASWYAATVEAPAPKPRAEGDIRADAVVVGGGYGGLTAAIHMARAGLDVVLLDASRLGSGASGRNGGQVSTGQRLEQGDLERIVGVEKARLLWEYGCEAVDLVRGLCAEAGDDCDWRDGVIHANHRDRYTADSRAHVEHMRSHYNYDRIRFLDRDEIRHEVGSPDYHSGTLDMGSGHLHPLRYALALGRLADAAGVRIFENTRVTAVEAGTARPRVSTAHATIAADHLVMALNGYHNNLEARIARRVMPINNFIAVTEPLPPDLADRLIPNRHAVADSRFVINYFRLSPDNRMIFGGGESYGYRFPEDLEAKVRGPMAEVFPALRETKVDYAWGGTLGITMSRLPHFARLGPAALTVSGFSGQGVTLATLAGKMAAEAVLGQAGRFDLMAGLPTAPFPGGPLLRTPLLAAAMIWYAMRDRM